MFSPEPKALATVPVPEFVTEPPLAGPDAPDWASAPSPPSLRTMRFMLGAGAEYATAARARTM